MQIGIMGAGGLGGFIGGRFALEGNDVSFIARGSHLKAIHESGLRVVKIRFSSIHYHANNKAAQKIIKEIEKLGMLPICHSDWTHYSNPLIIGDLASKFPNVNLLMQHFGEYLS